MELLSPAGSPEAVTAAVQNGAGAVYLGAGDFNARRGAANFTMEELRQAAEYCRVRGAKVYLTMNTLLSDRELPAAAQTALAAQEAGVDAILVQDLGVLRILRRVVPDMELHASTQMTLHSLDGVKRAADLGMRRAVLSRELSRDQIAYICQKSPIEIEVFVHGAICMCYSGQCFFSALLGGRSGNRGLCAQPCRLNYGWNGRAEGHPLSLKDMSLASHLKELEDMGVACLKIEGRMKRPEYVAVVTGIYSALLAEGRLPTPQEEEDLAQAFSRQGFTDGYFVDHTGPHMFGVRGEKTQEPKALFQAARTGYTGRERPRVPIALTARLELGKPALLTGEDDRGNRASAQGPAVEAARTRSLTAEQVQTQIAKTGGTPYVCERAEAQVGEGLSLPLSALNALRRQVLEDLTQARRALPPRSRGEMPPLPQGEARRERPVWTVSLSRAGQLTGQLLALNPAVIYLPLGEIEKAAPLVETALGQGVEVSVNMPRILWDREREQARAQLARAKELGVQTALAGELGVLTLAQEEGFRVRGDFGLGVCNAQALAQLKELGLCSVTASFEQRLARVRDLPKAVDTELLVYGRLPLMITENCIIRNRRSKCGCTGENQLTDRRGVSFPVVKAWGCRNEILNSKVLYLGDKVEEFSRLGLWGARLRFTTERPEECAAVLSHYAQGTPWQAEEYTRGLYYRDVE